MNIVEASKFTKIRRKNWWKDTYLFVSDIDFTFLIEYGSLDKPDTYGFTREDLEAQDWENAK